MCKCATGRLFALLALVLSASLAGCLPVKGGLADIAGSKADARLCGVWKSKEKKNQSLTIGRAKGLNDKSKEAETIPEGLMKLARVTYNDRDESMLNESHEFYAFTIGDYQYATVLPPGMSYITWLYDSTKQTYIFRYQLKENVLSMWSGDTDAYSALLRAKTIEEGGPALVAYLTKNGGDGLFPAANKMTYQRVTEK